MRKVIPENLKKEFKRFCMYLSAISGKDKIYIKYLEYDFEHMGIEWDNLESYFFSGSEKIELPSSIDNYLTNLLENTISEDTIYDNLPPSISNSFNERGVIDVVLFPQEFRMEIRIDYNHTIAETMVGGYDIDKVIGRIDRESIQEYIDNGDIFTVYFNGGNGTAEVEETGELNGEFMGIPDPVLGLCYNTLDMYYGGWVEDMHNSGKITVDFSNMTIDVEYTEYDTDYENIKYGEITI